MPTKSVRVHLAGENIVALCDTGSDGMGVGMSLIKEGVRNLWPRKFGRRITSKYSYAHNCGWTNNKYSGKITEDFVLNGEYSRKCL